MKVVKPTPTVSDSEAFLTTSCSTGRGNVSRVRQLEKPFAADKQAEEGLHQMRAMSIGASVRCGALIESPYSRLFGACASVQLI